MIREAYYINSKGVILNFLVDPYYTAEADWYDSEWDETASGYQKTVQVDVYGSGEGLAKIWKTVQRACCRCRSRSTWKIVRQ